MNPFMMQFLQQLSRPNYSQAGQYGGYGGWGQPQRSPYSNYGGRYGGQMQQRPQWQQQSPAPPPQPEQSQASVPQPPSAAPENPYLAQNQAIMNWSQNRGKEWDMIQPAGSQEQFLINPKTGRHISYRDLHGEGIVQGADPYNPFQAKNEAIMNWSENRGTPWEMVQPGGGQEQFLVNPKTGRHISYNDLHGAGLVNVQPPQQQAPPPQQPAAPAQQPPQNPQQPNLQEGISHQSYPVQSDYKFYTDYLPPQQQQPYQSTGYQQPRNWSYAPGVPAAPVNPNASDTGGTISPEMRAWQDRYMDINSAYAPTTINQGYSPRQWGGYQPYQGYQPQMPMNNAWGQSPQWGNPWMNQQQGMFQNPMFQQQQRPQDSGYSNW